MNNPTPSTKKLAKALSQSKEAKIIIHKINYTDKDNNHDGLFDCTTPLNRKGALLIIKLMVGYLDNIK